VGSGSDLLGEIEIEGVRWLIIGVLAPKPAWESRDGFKT
jgi:hypothetical protein